MTRRTQRVNELLRQEISLVLQQKLSDPRLGSLISVTRVETAEDFQQAKVYVSVLGAKEKREKAIQGLTAATHISQAGAMYMDITIRAARRAAAELPYSHKWLTQCHRCAL